MATVNWVDIIGYVAGFIVMVSLMMGNMRKLRWLNTGGAILFVGYSYVIAAWPVFVMNALIIGFNLWHLYKLYFPAPQAADLNGNASNGDSDQ